MDYDVNILRKIIAKCKWTFAKTMPQWPHEYIVRDKCPLSEDEWIYLLDMQRKHGIMAVWGPYNLPYLHIDGYKYWTMGDTYDKTTIINRAKESDKDLLHEVLDLVDGLYKAEKSFEDKRPYHLNILEYFSTNENANSSIFAKILEQHDERGNYSAIAALFGFLFPALSSKVDKPLIQTEVCVKNNKRIDILAFESGKYAVIFENKILEATEQKHQLANYIEGLMEKGYSKEQIYIVYLPATDEGGPSSQSWTNSKKLSYQEEFQNRYRKFSFRDGVLPWLKSLDIKSINDDWFQKSISVYIDFLEGMFKLRETDKMENQELTKYLSERLGFSGNDESDIDIIRHEIDRIASCNKKLNSLRKLYGCKILKEWSVKLRELYPDDTIDDYTELARNMYLGISVPYMGMDKSLAIRIQMDGNLFYYGYYCNVKDSNVRLKMQENLSMHKQLIEGMIKGVDWLYYQNVSFEDGFDLFIDLIKKTKNTIK